MDKQEQQRCDWIFNKKWMEQHGCLSSFLHLTLGIIFLLLSFALFAITESIRKTSVTLMCVVFLAGGGALSLSWPFIFFALTGFDT
jgi:hypothetical protein